MQDLVNGSILFERFLNCNIVRDLAAGIKACALLYPNICQFRVVHKLQEINRKSTQTSCVSHQSVRLNFSIAKCWHKVLVSKAKVYVKVFEG